ncbi:hypothetical protein GW17_00034382 [Ensete ventricosum]|nr:hypothetical protein GW17_00034382 [Ensete ventricosum]
MWTACYRAIPPKIDRRRSINGEIDRRQSIEEEKGKKKEEKKKKEEEKKEYRAVLAYALPPSPSTTDRPQAIAARAGRLKKKKEEKKKEYRAVLARARRRNVSRAGRKIEATRRFICRGPRIGPHPPSILVEPFLLYSGERNRSRYGAGLSRLNLSFNLRFESLNECP